MIGKPDEMIRWLLDQDREKTFEVKQYRQKRSLNANAYAWSLIGKIADILRVSKDDIYLKMLVRYGQSEVVSVLSEINVAGYFKYYEKIGESSLNGKDFTHYRVYKGSSEYDTREMAILIDGIVSECEEMYIETLPPHEIKRLKETWGIEL